jgi:hypothetical protein
LGTPVIDTWKKLLKLQKSESFVRNHLCYCRHVGIKSRSLNQALKKFVENLDSTDTTGRGGGGLTARIPTAKKPVDTKIAIGHHMSKSDNWSKIKNICGTCKNIIEIEYKSFSSK